jgi:hypothetical protein
VLYQPEIGSSVEALSWVVGVSVALVPAVYLLWWGHIDVRAPAEQQREAEQEA